jgi:hypothetical protein
MSTITHTQRLKQAATARYRRETGTENDVVAYHDATQPLIHVIETRRGPDENSTFTIVALGTYLTEELAVEKP